MPNSDPSGLEFAGRVFECPMQTTTNLNTTERTVWHRSIKHTGGLVRKELLDNSPHKGIKICPSHTDQ